MTDVDKVFQRWITSANEGRIKIGTKELSNDDFALIIQVLQCVAADCAALQPLPAEPPKEKI
jgi:hypothetical protein